MSKPKAGTYYIINKVISTTGQRLAVTFNDQGNPATVTPWLVNANLITQMWIIVDAPDGVNQTFVPVKNQHLEAAKVSLVITPMLIAKNLFLAKNTPKGLSIQDPGGSKASWTISSATTSSQVQFAGADGKNGDRSFWVLEPA